jgi:hypothetical protein
MAALKSVENQTGAETAAEIGQLSWLSMPLITAATDSPRRMMVKRPKRSGRCSASGGSVCVYLTAAQGVEKSISRATPQSQNRAGGGKSAATIQKIAAVVNPAA